MTIRDNNLRIRTYTIFSLFVLSVLILCSKAFCSDTTTTAPAFNVTIVSGQANIVQSGLETVITQSVAGNLIATGNLSTIEGEIVKIELMSSLNNVLLRDSTGLPTMANGSYFSNGGLFMVNPQGFVFGPNSQIQAANIVVSTLDINNDDFLAGSADGKFKFSGRGTYIINQGKLIPQPGGYVALLSGAISNVGTIQAQLGRIVLASGDKITMTTVDLDDLGTIFVVIDKAVENEIMGPDGNKITDAINNKGIISSDGGTITLTAKSLNTIFDNSINNSGIIEAKSANATGNGDVTLTANGPITSTGAIYSDILTEEGASFAVSGIFSPLVANIQNADNAITYTGTAFVSGTIEDAANIIISANTTVNLTGNTTFEAQTGSLIMTNSSSVINGQNNNLTIEAAQPSSLYTIDNVGTLTLQASSLGANPSFVFNTPVSVTNFVLHSGTVTLNDTANAVAHNVLTVSNAYAQDGGTFSETMDYQGNNLFSLSIPAMLTGATAIFMGPQYVGGGNTANSTDTAATRVDGVNALQSVGTALNNNYVQTANINLNGSDFTSHMIGSVSDQFTGTFNGNGYSISNFVINTPTQGVGLFGDTSLTAVLSNINLSGNISGGDEVGSLVGVNNGVISNSSSIGNLSGTGDFVGGLAGSSNGSINNSYNTGDVNGLASVGGLVGVNAGPISNSYNTGVVSADVNGSYVGGLAGLNAGAINNSYSTGAVSVSGNSGYIGGLVGSSSGVIGNSYSSGSVNGGSYIGGLVGLNSAAINSSHSTGSVNGDNYIGGLVGVSGSPISNSYSTGNVNMNSGTYVGGLVGENFNPISNSYSTGIISGSGNYAGGLVGGNFDSISNSHSSTGSVNTSGDYVGGLVGENNGSISNSYSAVNVSGGNNVGGLVGFDNINSSSISNSYSAGIIIGSGDFVGGLVGFSNGSISNSHNTGSVSGLSAVGGLVGQNGGPISDSYNTGIVIAAINDGYAGGLVGINAGAISNSYNTGGVNSSGNSGYVGGLVGSNSGAINYSFNTGGVSGSSYIGGLVGVNSAAIKFSYSTGSVSGNYYVGGLIGVNGSPVSNSYSTGSVNGINDVGGFAGENFNPINNSYSSGNVNGSSYVGGLVGDNENSIINSYSIGNVSGSTDVGGLVGLNDTGDSVTTSFSTGEVTATGVSSNVGGFVGNQAGTVSSSYWYYDPTGTPIHAFGNGTDTNTTMITDAQGGRSYFFNAANGPMSGWTFNSSNWTIDPGVSYAYFPYQIWTWTGNGDGKSWTDPNNWSNPNFTGYPNGNNFKVIINSGSNNITTPGSSAITLGSLDINPGFTGTLALGNNLTIDGSSALNGSLQLQAGTFISGANTVTLQGRYVGYLAGSINANDTNWIGGKLVIRSDNNQTLTNSETYDNFELGRYSGVGTTLYTMGLSSSIIGTGIIDSGAQVVLTVSASGVSKIYDGSSIATVNLSSNNIFTGYNVTYSDTGSSYTDQNVGTKTINVSGISLGGTDVGKFTLSATTASTTANIIPKPLTVSATGPAKVYGTALTAGPSTTNFTAAATGVGNQVVAGVTLTPDANGLSANTPAGTAYVVTPSAATGTGGFLASNYNISYLSFTGTVNPAQLTPPSPPIGITSSNITQAATFTTYDLLQTVNTINKITYETLNPYKLSVNTYEPLVYFYHPLTPINQSASSDITLDTGAYDFIQNSLELRKLVHPMVTSVAVPKTDDTVTTPYYFIK